MKTKKRVLSVLLAFAMVIGLMPSMSLAVFAADTSNGIYVNNVDARSTTSGSGWSYNAGTNTLTLNNYSFDGVGSAPPNDSTVIMYYPQNSNKFTINLVGNNTIKQGNGDTNRTWWGIYCRSDLVITGDGTLNISTTAGYRGAPIYCEQNVTIEGNCTVNATSGAVSSGPQGHGIGGDGSKTLTIKDNAKVTLIGPKGAANYTIKNSAAGLGWTNTDGTEGRADIASNTSGQDLSSYKKIQFPLVASVTSGSTTTKYADFKTAATEWKSAENGATLTLLTDVEIDSSQAAYISNNASIAGIQVNNQKTLDLNGHTISLASSVSYSQERVIEVANGGNLTIKDSSGTNAGKIKGATPTNDNGWSGGLYINRGGQATMNGGTITGNYTTNGAGVWIDGRAGSAPAGIFKMNGGLITGNTATYGGGVYVGCQLNDSAGTAQFNMDGGTITGNTATNGANVYLNHGVMTMTGGTINGGFSHNDYVAVTFDANGGTGTMSTQYVKKSTDTTIKKNEYYDLTGKKNDPGYSRLGYDFNGWNTKADGTGTNYIAGTDNINKNESTTLYAKWKGTWTKTAVFGSAPAGNLGSVDLSDYVASGGILDWANKVITGTYATDGSPTLEGTTLKFKFNTFAENVTEATGTVTIPVKGATSYNDYVLTVTISAPLKFPQILTFKENNKPFDKVEKSLGDDDFTYVPTREANVPENAPAYNGGISYSSSKEAVAIVNSSTGEVEIKGVGETIITATASGTTTNNTFEVSGEVYAGYLPASASYSLTVNKADPTVTPPTARSLTANGSAQELVTGGSTTGGTLQFALGTETEATEGYTESVPKGTEAGTYYVWYMAKGNENYNDSVPGRVKVTIASPSSTPSGGGESGGSTTPTGETFTGKVEGSGDNTASTTVSATIENGTASIAEVKPEEIQKVAEATPAGETTNLVLDVSGAPASVTAIEIPKATIENIAAAVSDDTNAIEGTTISLPGGTIELDAQATQAINDQAQGNTVKIEIVEVKQSDLTPEQKEVLQQSGLENAKVISVSVTSGGQTISDYQGGSGVISFKDKAPEGANPDYFHMFFLNTDGTMERMLTTYKGDDCKYLVSHTSDYVLIYDETDLNENRPPIIKATASDLIYDGTEQAVKVSDVIASAVEAKDAVVPADAYVLSGDVKVKDVGTYKVVISAKDDSGYRGSTEVTFSVKKADQKMSVEAKDVKAKRGKKIKPEKVFTIENAVGKVKYTKVEGDKKIKISDTGKIKIKKNLKKGKYTVKVLVSSEGDGNYNGAEQTVEFVIKVK